MTALKGQDNVNVHQGFQGIVVNLGDVKVIKIAISVLMAPIQEVSVLLQKIDVYVSLVITLENAWNVRIAATGDAILGREVQGNVNVILDSQVHNAMNANLSVTRQHVFVAIALKVQDAILELKVQGDALVLSHKHVVMT
jgi:hypothetical protein